MARRNYSVVEVEALIPSLEQIFSRILQLRIGLRALEKKLERAGVTIDLDGTDSARQQAGGAGARSGARHSGVDGYEANSSDADQEDGGDERDEGEAEIELEAQELEEEAEDTESTTASEAADTPAIRHAQAVFRGYYEALSDGLEEIRALGGDVKDLDLGLVDFPGKRGNDDILLCWRLGEKRIEFWHTVEGGFANRRRLDERIPRTPSRAE